MNSSPMCVHSAITQEHLLSRQENLVELGKYFFRREVFRDIERVAPKIFRIPNNPLI